MADDTTAQTASSAVVIPPGLQETHPDLVALVMASESMNNEERQYWFDILPAMTPEQVQQLRDILTNEKTQLAAIDAKYTEEIKKAGTASVELTDEERHRKQQALQSQEMATRNEETVAAEDLLKQMD